jgi:YHS domain-containing protein
MNKTREAIVTVVLAGGLLNAAPSAQAGARAERQPPDHSEVCPVSGNPLAIGEPFAFEYAGQEIKFCCTACLDSFNEDPSKYVSKTESARNGHASLQSLAAHEGSSKAMATSLRHKEEAFRLAVAKMLQTSLQMFGRK